jgi:dienelactone hydrolase
MHWLDALLGLRALGPKMFARGWGDRARIAELAAHDLHAPAAAIEPRLHRVAPGVYEGCFVHPLVAAWLPPASRVAHVRWHVPSRPRGAYVHLASTGDEGWARRLPVVEAAFERGLASLVLENPYYGRRRSIGQQTSDLDTVSDQLAMSMATVEEARALLGWLSRSFGQDVGVAGFSMGGSVAALTATTWRAPLAVVAVATGHAAETVFCDGALSRFVDFAAVDRQELRRALSRGDLERVPAPPVDSRCELVAARDDGYVPAWSVQRLHDTLRARGVRVGLEWTSGGHASLLLRGRRRFVAALDRALARDQAQPCA